MKKLMMSIFIVTALASCSSENEIIDNGGIKGDERVEIKLKAGVSNVETKSAITQWAGNEKLTFYHPNGSTYETWKATVTSLGAISFIDDNGTPMSRYYDIDASKKTQLIGLYASNAKLESDKIIISLDGDEDIMTTVKVEGDKNTEKLDITFQHLLTQLVLNVKSTDGTNSMQVSNLVIKGNKGSVELALSGFTADSYGTPTFKEPDAGKSSDITVINTETAINDVTNSVLVAPGSTLSMDITVDGKEFTNIPIAPETGVFEPTTSYTVDLTVTQKEISSVTATPGKWVPATDHIKVPVEDPANNPA